MLCEQLPPHEDLKLGGRHSRGYLPHFDGREIPQFITCRLIDSVPDTVLLRWIRELDLTNSKIDQPTLQKRVEKYLDQGHGACFLNDRRIAQIVQSDFGQA